MGEFKKFLVEGENLLDEINSILLDMDEDEIDEYGCVLYSEFFGEDDEDEIDSDCDSFTLEEIQQMLVQLEPDVLELALELLDEVGDEEELEEGVSRRLINKNRNRKKRKFMANSKASLRKTKSSRKKDARRNKTKNKRYYKANKKKIQSYQKSRSSAIKKGKHVVKKRRKAG